jgi:hypothetical protein
LDRAKCRINQICSESGKAAKRLQEADITGIKTLQATKLFQETEVSKVILQGLTKPAETPKSPDKA